MYRILIVDDEPHVLAGIRRAIGRHFEVEAVTSVEDALQCLSTGRPFAAIISDLAMAAGDGLSLLERARRLAPRVPRIMLTGHGDRKAMTGAINRAGVSAFLHKPTPPAELLNVLKEVIATAQSEQEFADASMNPDHAWVARELDRARLDDHFRVMFQPRVSAADGSVQSAEALLRWHHPERGPIPASVFIPVAESTGWIHEATGWVLQRAAHAWSELSQAGLDLSISVNLSARTVDADGALDRVRWALQQAAMPAHRLEVELTEGHRLQDPARARDLLAGLRTMGVRTALDDFGVGFSTLETLRQLDVDVLKIDRSYVTDLASNPKHEAIVRSIVDLARALHLEIVAEGVETLEQARLLNSIGVDQFQGFLFSPALSTRQLFEQCLRRSRTWDFRQWQSLCPQELD